MNTFAKRSLLGGKAGVLRLTAHPYVHLALVLFVLLAAYHRLFSSYFLSDDFNLLLGSSNWLNPQEGFFRPIPHLLIHFLYLLSGLEVFPYHLLCLIIHYLNAVLLYLILRKMVSNNYFALAGSLLFAVNFLISEAVFWISAITTLSVSLFYLLGIYIYMNYLSTLKTRFYLLAMLCCIFCLLCKENGVTLPVLLVMVDICHNCGKGERFRLWAALKRAAPFFLITFGYLIVKTHSLSAAVARDSLSLGYHNLRNVRHLLLSLFTFNPFHDLPFLYIDITILNLFLKNPIPNLRLELDGSQFFLPLVLGSVILIFCLYLLLKGHMKVRLSLAALVISMGPFIFISSHHMAYGGYFLYPLRLYYLPAAFFFIFLAVLLSRGFCWLKKRIKSMGSIVVLMVLLTMTLTLADLVRVRERSSAWLAASRITKSVLHQLEDFMPGPPGKNTLVLFNLPDNYLGAYIFRNGIHSAVKLHYPGVQVNIEVSASSPENYRVSSARSLKDTLFIDCGEGKLTRFYPGQVPQ